MEIFLSALVSYFVIVDPVGVALIFEGLTEGHPASYRSTLALRSVVISLCVVVFFGFFGSAVLNRLGISIEAFRIAGGLLLFYTAFGMVTQPNSFMDETESRSGPTDLAVFPLSFPLIAGPGCLTLTILLFTKSQHHFRELGVLIGAIVIIFSLTLACFMGSSIIQRIMGKTGNNVLKRLLGVVLASFAIQFVITGVRATIHAGM